MPASNPPNPGAKRKPLVPATTMVLVMLCLMYLINYVCRVNVSTAAGGFKDELHFSNTQLGALFSAYGVSSRLFQIIGGWVSDRFGAPLTLTVLPVISSGATIALGMAQ